MSAELEAMVRSQAVETAEAAHHLAKALAGNEHNTEGLDRLRSAVKVREEQFDRLIDLLDQEGADEELLDQSERLQAIWTGMLSLIDSK